MPEEMDACLYDSSSVSCSEGGDADSFLDQIYSDDECSDGMEAGSVACIYTQLICVVVFFIWMSSVPSGWTSYVERGLRQCTYVVVALLGWLVERATW